MQLIKSFEGFGYTGMFLVVALPVRIWQHPLYKKVTELSCVALVTGYLGNRLLLSCVASDFRRLSYLCKNYA